MNEALAGLAARHGVAVEYFDQSGDHHLVPPETIVAVLAALGVAAADDAQIAESLAEAEVRDWRRTLPPVFVHRQSRDNRIWVHVPHGDPVTAHLVWEDGSGSVPAEQVDHVVAPRLLDGKLVGEAAFAIPAGLPLGYHQFQAHTAAGVAMCPLIVVPDRMPRVQPGWGLMVQLYSARSRRSWGIGDLGDLATLSESSASYGADFVLVNPLHAASPAAPMEPSPYLPVTRRFQHPVYLDLNQIIESTELTGEQLNRLAEIKQEVDVATASATAIDWELIWGAKRAALELLWAARSTSEDDDLQQFVHREGVALQDFALWCALADEHGPRWQEWPEPLRDVRGEPVTAAFARLEEQVIFHSWLQFRLDRQMTKVQQKARDSGMAIGVMHDLAVGVHADGADTWRLGHLLAADVSVGAPPDMYNQQGQNWAQPPWQPAALAEAAFVPYRDMLRAVLRHAGGLRVDHILGLYRQWWIPDGMAPAAGTYVAIDHEAMVGILMLEAVRVGAVVIGEDLGTVADWIRSDMHDRGILGTGVLWFERDGDINPPEQWRADALASVTVHDLPPTAGYLAGEHIRLRDRLGLLAQPVAEVAAEHEREIGEWRGFLAQRGWLADEDADTHEVIAALHRCLASSPAVLLGVSLPDLVGEVRAQNQPGTHREYPNWCVPLADADGRPVFVDEVTQQPLWEPVVDIVNR